MCSVTSCCDYLFIFRFASFYPLPSAFCGGIQLLVFFSRIKLPFTFTVLFSFLSCGVSFIAKEAAIWKRQKSDKKARYSAPPVNKRTAGDSMKGGQIRLERCHDTLLFVIQGVVLNFFLYLTVLLSCSYLFLHGYPCISLFFLSDFLLFLRFFFVFLFLFRIILFFCFFSSVLRVPFLFPLFLWLFFLFFSLFSHYIYISCLPRARIVNNLSYQLFVSFFFFFASRISVYISLDVNNLHFLYFTALFTRLPQISVFLLCLHLYVFF